MNFKKQFDFLVNESETNSLVPYLTLAIQYVLHMFVDENR